MFEKHMDDEMVYSISVFKSICLKIMLFSGVLHHLKDPTEALAILASLLKEDGGMQLMVYAW